MTAGFPRSVRVRDFWRVNSYGYPCFFAGGENSEEAWTTLLSFFEFTNYESLKTYWDSRSAPRKITAHAVESWKATFEEFGLLYVESRSNRITITPAGTQLREAADRNDKAAFAWIGLTLLLRYPLRGPRRPKSNTHALSDLLVYRFWYSALLDLDQYCWWSELERILCRVFRTSDAIDAIEDVKTLRTDPSLLSKLDLPVSQKKGGFYNSLNQVAVHAGMNHLLMGVDYTESPYGKDETSRRQFIRPEWLGLIRRALSDNVHTDQCSTGGLAAARLPAAPSFGDEISFFEYLGARVSSLDAAPTSAPTSVALLGEKVFILNEGEHYSVASDTRIVGPVAVLCHLARGQRVILSHDQRWTYLVEQKNLVDSSRVVVSLRRARPISDMAAIRSLIKGD